MIKIRGVNKRFNDFVALEDINIDIKKGTIHGIIGENGAGKTFFTKKFFPQNPYKNK